MTLTAAVYVDDVVSSSVGDVVNAVWLCDVVISSMGDIHVSSVDGCRCRQGDIVRSSLSDVATV